MRSWTLLMMATGAVALSCDALAHHSYAMFDRARTIEAHGTVAKFEWTNPHVFLWVYVRPDAAGAAPGYALFGFEGGSPGTLIRDGWSPDTFHAGERIAVSYYPLKDGRNGGSFFKAVYADGSVSISGGGPNSNERPQATP